MQPHIVSDIFRFIEDILYKDLSQLWFYAVKLVSHIFQIENRFSLNLKRRIKYRAYTQWVKSQLIEEKCGCLCYDCVVWSDFVNSNKRIFPLHIQGDKLRENLFLIGTINLNEKITMNRMAQGSLYWKIRISSLWIKQMS